MARLRWITVYWLAGFSFWIPDIIIHVIRGNQFGSGALDIMSVVTFPVIAAVLSLNALSHGQQDAFTRRTVALWILLGIWMLGPLCTMIGATFSGGGFTQPGTWHMIFLGVVLFVPLTFMMSSYDGALGALAIVTVWFIVVAIKNLTCCREQVSPRHSP
jgi:hypothetical protein